MRKKIAYLMLLFSAVQSGCERQQQKQAGFDFPPPEVFEAKGYIVPGNKIAPPEISPAKEIKRKVISKPEVVNLKSNVRPAGKPIAVSAGAPKICVPGHDGFSFPEIVPAVDSPFAAGSPHVTIAGEPQINENSPANFSSFKVRQGLAGNMIFPIIQDKTGNLWIACFESGLCKYDGRSFTTYSSAQGLSNEDISSMMEDSNGNLWFGTFGGGLIKFDGKLFTNYTTKQGLSNNTVLSILEDKKRNLWFGTEGGGINKYDGKTFTHYTIAQGLINNLVRSIIEDSKGNIWVGTNGGMSKFDGKSFSNFSTEQGLSNTDITSILQDSKGHYWISTYGDGVNKYDGRSFEHYSALQGLSSKYVNSILQDKNGNLWFATIDKGVIKYDGTSFTQFSVDEGLSGHEVHGLLEDKAGTFWFGTNQGLCKYDEKLFTHFNYSRGFSEGIYSSILEDKTGNIWVGVYGGGVNRFDGKSVIHYTTEQGLSYNDGFCLLKDDNNLWIGTNNHGLNKYDGRSFIQFENLPKHLGVWSMLKDSKRNVWLGTSKGLYKYDGKNFTHFGIAQGLSSESITSICEDKKGNLWLGTEYDSMVNKLDLSAAETGKYSFTHYNITQGLALSVFYCILKDKKDNLWFGSSNSGVIKFDGRFFTRYTIAQGLSNNSVNSIVEDKDGDIWFLTSNGLCNMKSLESIKAERRGAPHTQISLFNTYLYSDGFLGVGSHLNSMIIDRDGNIWAGAGNRLTCYHRERDIPDTSPPAIQLSSVMLFNEGINWLDVEKKKDSSFTLGNGTKVSRFNFSGLSRWYNQPENLQLAYNDNFITFQVIGITTNRPKAVRYQYFLKGLDENRSIITAKPEATYNNLPPGKYTFKVKAVNGEGYWSDELNYPFTIFPPWWQTRFAYISYMLVFLVALAVFIRRRERKLRKEKLLLEEKVTARTLELQKEKEKVENTLTQLETLQVQLVETEKTNERLRISRELHDDIGGTLSGIVLYSHLAQNQVVTQNAGEAKNSLDIIQQSANDMVNRLNDIVWSINPEHNSLKNLIQKLEEYAREMAIAKNIKVQVNAAECLAQIQLPVETCHNIYLFGKEAINNAIKYSHASLLQLSAYQDEDIIELTIKDNGQGFDTATVRKGNGLINMQKRADDIAAMLSLQSALLQGTFISLKYKIT
jgi:ligand-binding sensor domain-containing protein/signal transduction histidine kinase